ncbi:MAG TPA: flavodoxin domain-containing protein, partial [Methanocellaceae archaeon]
KTGNTAKAAEEIGEGVKESGAEVILKKAEEATKDDILVPNGIILGAYCMLDKAPPAMRKFVEKQMAGADLDGKVGAVFGSYKKSGKQLPKLEGALNDKKVKIVAEGVNSLGAPDAETLKKLRGLGKKVGKEAMKK